MIMNIYQQFRIGKVDIPELPNKTTERFHLCFCFVRRRFSCLEFSLKFKKNDTSVSLAFGEGKAEGFAVDGEFDFFLDGGCCPFIAAVLEIGECDILIVLIGLVFDPDIVESL